MADQQEQVATLAPPREAVVGLIRERLAAQVFAVVGGAHDGVQAVRWEDVEFSLGQPLPPPSDHAAEVATPGDVLVATGCPRCGLPERIVLHVDAQLQVDAGGSELHLKGKSKAHTHVCGQQTLDEAAAAASQSVLDDWLRQVGQAEDDTDRGPADG